jgi:crotonobetainyl-CoA:carnitine CoA-transferase CaiB-like acyl-CoA transferase
MTAILHGVRILEVAERTFVPAASALLADLGADVIKIEHVERGDAMRGLASTGLAGLGGDVHALLEHSNRGKRSLAVDLTSSDGLDVLYRLAATADVFLINKLPGVRAKVGIGGDQIRSANDRIVYVRGTGQGERGPEADKGSYESLAFWAAPGRARVDTPRVRPRAPAAGPWLRRLHRGHDHRRRDPGRALPPGADRRDLRGRRLAAGVGLWAMGQAIALSDVLGIPVRPPPADQSVNPLAANYRTRDGRWIALTCLQAGRYRPNLCEIMGRPDLATDERFADQQSLVLNGSEAIAILNSVFAEATLDEWKGRLETFTGQWAVVQDSVEAAADAQTEANGYLQECRTASGHPFRLVAVPMQFDGAPAAARRAPEFNEHGDEIRPRSASTRRPCSTCASGASWREPSPRSHPRVGEPPARAG